MVLGTNAILAYLISEIGDTLLRVIHLGSGLSVKAAWTRAFQTSIASPAVASLLFSLSYLAVCWLITYPFYRKRIFLRI